MAHEFAGDRALLHRYARSYVAIAAAVVPAGATRALQLSRAEHRDDSSDEALTAGASSSSSRLVTSRSDDCAAADVAEAGDETMSSQLMGAPGGPRHALGTAAALFAAVPAVAALAALQWPSAAAGGPLHAAGAHDAASGGGAA